MRSQFCSNHSKKSPCSMRSLAPSLLPPEIDLTYNSGTRSARFGPPAMLPGPAVNSMVGRSEEENGRAVVAAASPTEVTRNPEVVDFEKLLGDLSAAFVRVSVEDIDTEIERWLERIVLSLNVDRSTVVQVDPTDGALYSTHQWARDGVSTPDRGIRTSVAAVFPWL